MTASRVASKAGSRLGTPVAQTPDESDYHSPLITGELHQRLQELTFADGDVQKKDAFLHSVTILQYDRRKTALLAREKALSDILNVLTLKYEPELVSVPLFAAIIDAFITHRSDLEAALAAQLSALILSMANNNHPQSEDLQELVSQRMLPSLLRCALGENNSTTLRTQVTIAYATHSYFMNIGGGGYGMDRIANELLGIAETTVNGQASLTSSALNGVSLILFILSGSELTVLAQNDILPTISQFFDTPSPDVQNTAAKLLGVVLERYNGPEEELEEPKDKLEEVLQESSHRTARRDKKSRKSIIRDVLKTSSSSKPTTLTHFRLSQHKALKINSWKLLAAVEHLKWVFGPGLQTHLANNAFLRGIFEDEDYDGDISVLVSTPRSESHENEQWDQNASPVSKANRETNRRQARLDKAEYLGILGNDG